MKAFILVMALAMTGSQVAAQGLNGLHTGKNMSNFNTGYTWQNGTKSTQSTPAVTAPVFWAIVVLFVLAATAKSTAKTINLK